MMFQSALNSLGVLMPQEADVRSYLALHPDVTEAVEGICRSARLEFGPNAALILGVYQDPEIDDQYLSLYVRLESYPPDVLDRIREVSAAHDDAMADKSGFLLVTTDFRVMDAAVRKKARPPAS
jgi:hypothetical protein